MSAEEEPIGQDEIAPEETPGYKPPVQRALSLILETDKDDPAFEKYKAQLLGTELSKLVIIDEDVSQNVIIRKMQLLTDEKDDLCIDLSQPKDKIKETNFVIKEGVSYRIRISFQVQRDIVTGLKYVHAVKKMGLPVEKETYMCGSYGPKTDMQEYTTPRDDMPSGVVARGKYKVCSLFTDDDKNEILKWEWGFQLKSDWD